MKYQLSEEQQQTIKNWDTRQNECDRIEGELHDAQHALEFAIKDLAKFIPVSCSESFTHIHCAGGIIRVSRNPDGHCHAAWLSRTEAS